MTEPANGARACRRRTTPTDGARDDATVSDGPAAGPAGRRAAPGRPDPPPLPWATAAGSRWPCCSPARRSPRSCRARRGSVQAAVAAVPVVVASGCCCTGSGTGGRRRVGQLADRAGAAHRAVHRRRRAGRPARARRARRVRRAAAAAPASQIDTERSPRCRATPEILLPGHRRVRAAHDRRCTSPRSSAGAPAAAGVPLLAVFAVPAALADDLLPWWAMVAAAAGFGLLLVARRGGRAASAPARAALVVASAVLAALAVGAGAGVRRHRGPVRGPRRRAAARPARSGSARSPRCAASSTRAAPVELFRVARPGPAHLPARADPARLRARHRLAGQPARRRARRCRARSRATRRRRRRGRRRTIENVALPRLLAARSTASPLAVAGLPDDQWPYDAAQPAPATRSARGRRTAGSSGRCCPARPPTTLRAAAGADGRRPELPRRRPASTRGSPQLAAADHRRPRPTGFDKAMALQEYFTGPNSQFRYSLQTAPGNGDDALVEFLTVGQHRVLRAVRLGDGRDAAHGRRARPGRRRVHRRHRGRRLPLDQHLGRARLGGGVVPRHRLDHLRPDPAHRRPRDHPALRRGGPRARRPARTPPPQPDELAPEDASARSRCRSCPARRRPRPPPPPAAGRPRPAAAGCRCGRSRWCCCWSSPCVGAPAGLRVRAPAPAARGGARRRAGRGRGGVGGAARRVARPGRPGPGHRHRARRRPPAGARAPPRHRAQQACGTIVEAVEASWYGGGHPAPGALDGAVRGSRAGIVAGSALTLRQRLLPRSGAAPAAATPAPADPSRNGAP